MKLLCDVCNGELQMNANGQAAVCCQCGISYPLERLKEKIAASKQTPEPVNHTEQNHIYDCDDFEVIAPEVEHVQMRTLQIHRKKSTVLYKVAVYLDGEQCAMLEKSGCTVEIPISQGEHALSFRIASANGLEELTTQPFRVENQDLMGVFYLQRRAFDAVWKFDLKERA